jgi:4-hydroxy-3-methylbut-2-en-1-yl diphosphate reductase
MMVQRGDEVDLAWLDGVETLGLTAGASAPETLVREVVERLAQYRTITEETIVATEEKMVFKLPRELTG